MSARAKLTSSINKFGRTVRILKDAGNITEKHLIVSGFGARAEKTPFPMESSYFLWSSEIRAGDICQDMLTEDRTLIASLDYLGVNGSKDGIRVTELKCNDSIILYELVPTSSLDEFGKKNYNPTVRLNDYAGVFHNVRGDSLAPIGEIDKNQVIIIFSGRKIGSYLPKEGDRLVILSGAKYQIDGVDAHIYPGSFKTLCSPDQRTE